MQTTTDPTTVAELVQQMAQAARWAPSVHNTQPWRLRAQDDGLAVLVDPSRALPQLDPDGRLRTMSCGAAVHNAETALRAAGFTPRVTLLPVDGAPDVLAVVRVGHERAPSALEQRLAEAIPRRRAHRRVHRHEPEHAALLQDVALDVRRLGARLTLANAAARTRLADLLAEAVALQAARPELVAEVEAWVRRWGPVRADDGIPVESLGTAPFPVDSLVHDAAVGADPRPEDIREVLSWSTVMAISTTADTTRDWLTAGRALEHLWLHATVRDLAVSFTDQATQAASTRRRLPELFDLLGQVQVVVRVGRPLVDVPATPRRPLTELMA